MSKTDYYRAESISQAVDLLKKYGDKAMLLAGGTDIMVLENQYALPDDIVFIGIEDIAELRQISEKEDGIHIGSMVTTNEIIDSGLIKDSLNALYMAAKESASTQVRNRATIGGNVATASPSGDLLTALIALEADAVIAGVYGEKTVKVEEIPIFVKKTSLAPTDVIKEFIVQRPEANEGSFFVKMGKRKAMTISIVSVAAKVKLSDDRAFVEKAVVAAGACAPTPKRLVSLEAAAAGCQAVEEAFEKIASKTLDDIAPITDIRGTAWYRKEIAQVFAKRALCGAVSQIEEVQ